MIQYPFENAILSRSLQFNKNLIDTQLYLSNLSVKILLQMFQATSYTPLPLKQVLNSASRLTSLIVHLEKRQLSTASHSNITSKQSQICSQTRIYRAVPNITTPAEHIGNLVGSNFLQKRNEICALLWLLDPGKNHLCSRNLQIQRRRTRNVQRAGNMLFLSVISVQQQTMQ